MECLYLLSFVSKDLFIHLEKKKKGVVHSSRKVKKLSYKIHKKVGHVPNKLLYSLIGMNQMMTSSIITLNENF
jgi:hypothetical protein